MQNSRKMRVSASPAPPNASFTLSNRSTPVTPTPKRDHGQLLRSPISMLEFNSKKPSRDDSMFLEYKALLRCATTLTTFEWDAKSSTGTLVPISYPLDEEGRPVEPLQLPNFLATHDWDRPSCFCVMRGSPRKAQFLVPSWRESPSLGQMCLVCPASECSYFVNISELMDKYKDSILSIKDVVTTEADSDASGGEIVKDVPPKRKKRNLRRAPPKGKKTAARPSSSTRPQSNTDADDCLTVGLASTLSNLLGRHGALQEQFYESFRICNHCHRIVCNETSMIGGHVCIIKID